MEHTTAELTEQIETARKMMSEIVDAGRADAKSIEAFHAAKARAAFLNELLPAAQQREAMEEAARQRVKFDAAAKNFQETASVDAHVGDVLKEIAVAFVAARKALRKLPERCEKLRTARDAGVRECQKVGAPFEQLDRATMMGRDAVQTTIANRLTAAIRDEITRSDDPIAAGLEPFLPPRLTLDRDFGQSASISRGEPSHG